jgi:hypothetical protein
MVTIKLSRIGRSLKRVLLSVWFLGLIIAIPVILFLPPLFNKYKAPLVLQETAAHPYSYRIYFRDLDGSGIKQKIYAFQNGSEQLSFQYFGDNGGMINQVNFRHKFAPTLFFLVPADVDGNGIAEIYGFTLGKDSLFLNWKELVQPFSNSSESLFISKVGTFNDGSTNVSINRFIVMDINGDGKNEIVFSVCSGYSKFPRMVVLFNPGTRTLIKSEDLGINPFYLTNVDLNRDGNKEFLAASSAGYNLADSDSAQVIDSRPYLLGYTSGLKQLFPPVPFPSGIYNTLQFFVNRSNLNEIVVFQFNRSLAPGKMVKIFKVDFKGNLRDSVFLPEYGKRFNFQVFHIGGNFWLYTGDKIVVLNNFLQVTDVRKIENSTTIYRNALMESGSPEFVTVNHSLDKACIYTEAFRQKVEKKYKDENIRNVLLDISESPDYFMIQTTNNEYTYHFQRNGLYYLKYSVYLAIYLLSVLFVWLVQNIRERQLREKFELKNQLKDLEIKYLRMQMDPHFMFNAFTTMALMIKNGDRETAFDSFMKFTRMLRSNFDFSDNLTRPLSEELQTVSYYLEINKLRFKDKLDYVVKVADEVPVNALIPKMALQIHVENSLKHGLSQLDKTGLIRIEVIKDGEYLCLTEEDNGIGRHKAASLKRPSTKQGIKMLLALMDRLNQYNKLKITQTYTDLTDGSGNPCGTRVDIRVPLNLKE